MKGVIEKGADHISRQYERITKLMTGKLSEKKIAELNLKLNIIGSFRFQLKPTKEEL